MHDQSDSAQQTHTDPLTTWLTSLRLGDPITQGPLALVPVFADGAPNSLKYRTLADAIARGEVTVTELPTAQVPTLRLTNTGSLPVLIIDGEEVVGGKQLRGVNTSLLVPAKSTFDLPVTCVEQGRWQGVRPAFDAGEDAEFADDAGEVVPTGLRMQGYMRGCGRGRPLARSLLDTGEPVKLHGFQGRRRYSQQGTPLAAFANPSNTTQARLGTDLEEALLGTRVSPLLLESSHRNVSPYLLEKVDWDEIAAKWASETRAE